MKKKKRSILIGKWFQTEQEAINYILTLHKCFQDKMVVMDCNGGQLVFSKDQLKKSVIK